MTFQKIGTMARALADYIDDVIALELHELWSPIGQLDPIQEQPPEEYRKRMAACMLDRAIAADLLRSLMFRDDDAERRARTRIRAILRGEPTA